jgi:hypothetical protein
MKGRRKHRTSKWTEKKRYSEEAKTILNERKKKFELLTIAAEYGATLEPVGWLAGHGKGKMR